MDVSIAFIAGLFAMGAVWFWTDYLSRESPFRKGYRAAMFLYHLKHSEQPEQRWTPVTEGLPKCEQEVLICTKKKNLYQQKVWHGLV